MSSGMDETFLSGNLCADPELRYTGNGVAVCNFRMAINRSWKGKDGAKKDDVCFLPVVVWGSQGERCASLKKGEAVLVHGHHKMETWDSPTGKRTTIKIEADRVNKIDYTSASTPASRAGASEDAPPPYGDDEVPF